MRLLPLRRHSGARAARTRNPLGRNDRGWMDSGLAPLRFAPRNDGGGLSPSLRANGSRECAPDDRLREAIHVTARGDMDCFVASLLAMTAVRIPATRMRPSFFQNMPLHKPEGAGNAGCALHPRSHTQREKGAHEHTGSAEAPGHPLRNGLRLIPRSCVRKICQNVRTGGSQPTARRWI
jgi:hypothetical protein